MNYIFERLSDSIEIAVSQAHTFGTDAVILSHFAKPKYKDTALDMGTGCGIIPLLWLRDEKISGVHCLDIQENAIRQVQASIAHNCLEGRLIPHICDLRQMQALFPAESFSLVTMNPPYKPMHTGIISLDESAQIARHEVCCALEDAVKAAAYILQWGGRFCLCHRPERLVDTLALMRAYQVEPKRLRFVADKAGQEPFLFLVEGKKGAKPFLRVEPVLVIKNEAAKLSEEMLEIYGSYAEGHEEQIR